MLRCARSTTGRIPKQNTLDAYRFILPKFADQFGERELDSITTEELLSFLSPLIQDKKQATKRDRYSTLHAFFSFIRDSFVPDLKNPGDAQLLRKMFRSPKFSQWDFIEKETVDEIIFNIPKLRNRLLVEVMARGGLRINEALKLRAKDVDLVFISNKVANRLKEYIAKKGLHADQRLFPIGYSTAREMVRQAGERVGVALRPHDLRRHAATYASRCGTPIEIVSKVILRHAHLATTQRYLGKVSDTEAMRWIQTLNG